MTIASDPHGNKSIELGADHVWQFDDASGSFVDRVAALNATAAGSPTYQVADQNGSPSAIDFDGSADFGSLGSDVMNGMTAYTLEAVVATDATGTLQVIFDNRDASGDGVALDHSGAGAWQLRHNATNINGGASVAGEFAHIIGTWDGTNLALYVENVSVDTDTDSSAISTTATPKIARRAYASGQFWNGKIAHLAVYPTALDADDRAALIAAAQGGSRQRSRLRVRGRRRHW